MRFYQMVDHCYKKFNHTHCTFITIDTKSTNEFVLLVLFTHSVQQSGKIRYR